VGPQFDFGLYNGNNISLRLKTGFGFWESRNELKTDAVILNEYLLVPGNERGLYGYISLGLEHKLSETSYITMDGGIGFNQISLGYKRSLYKR
jgi:hypothetical protein